MKIKTSELQGVALDWAVAQCEGEDYSPTVSYDGIGNEHPATSYSTDWAQGGPILYREAITTGPYHGNDGKPTGVFQAYIGWDVEMLSPLFIADGPTPLIVGMRCYVASKLGDTVEVPDELPRATA